MRCMKCGAEITGTIADSLSHVCTAQPKRDEELERPERPLRSRSLGNDNFGRLVAAASNRRVEAQSAGEQAEIEDDEEKYIPDDLDREIELANRRDFGPGEEREDRYQRGSLADDVQPEIDRRGVDAEVPTDTYDRAEFLAREMRFPNEQRAHMKDKPLDHGMVSFLLTPEEREEFLRTGKLPQVSEDRKHYADQERQVAGQAPPQAQAPSL